jgi:hypothetical protein
MKKNNVQERKEKNCPSTPSGSHPPWSSLRNKPCRSRSPWPLHHVRDVVVFCANNDAVQPAWDNLTLFHCIRMQCISLFICEELHRHAQILLNFFVDSCCSWWKSTGAPVASVRKLLDGMPGFWSVLSTVLLHTCRVPILHSCKCYSVHACI